MSTPQSTLIIRKLGLCEYTPTWQAMQDFTQDRNANTPDELWLLQHPPVFTLGRIGKPEHLLNTGDIEVVRCDRGGQVTYHGPGQLVVYLLLDIKRKQLGIRHVVSAIEQAVIDLLGEQQLTAKARKDAPGVYLDDAKIASLGLRVKNGCTYHGLSLNVNMNLEPFSRINPCGYQGLRVTQFSDHCPQLGMEEVESRLLIKLSGLLGYNRTQFTDSAGASALSQPSPLTTETEHG